MSVRKLENGRWEARPNMGRDTDGKRINLRKRFDTKREADDWDRAMESQADNWCSYTVAEFYDLLYLPYISERVRAMTLDHYKRDFERLVRPSLGRMMLQDVRAFHIQRLLNSMDTYGAQSNAYKLLRQMLRRARAWGYIQTVATDGVELPKHRRAPITIAEPSRLPEYLAAVEEHEPDIAAGICVSMMGARRSEVCALDWSDVVFQDDGTAAVTIGKSVSYVDGERVVSDTKTEHSARVIMLPSWLASAMRRHRSFGAVVPVQPDAYSKKWRRAVKAAGLPDVSLKNLRHTVGTALAERLPINTVATVLGHDDITTTRRFYLQQTEGMMQQAAAAMGEVVEIHVDKDSAADL